jgi:hypothetical protein
LRTWLRRSLLIITVSGLATYMLDMGIGSGEEQALIAVRPSHQVRTPATLSNLPDLTVSDRPVQRA